LPSGYFSAQICEKIIFLAILPSIKELHMAAMKPRTGDGPMEAERELRGLIILRVPLEGGGRLVVSVNDEEAKELHDRLAEVVKK
jgi:hypothetical protein